MSRAGCHAIVAYGAVAITADGLNPTVSIGVAVCPDHGSDAIALQATADTAMYQAKRLGKDRTQLAIGPGRARPRPSSHPPA